MPATSIRALQDNTISRLDSIFTSAEMPEKKALSGDFEGNVPGVRSGNYASISMKPIEFLSKLNILPWRGKSFRVNDDDSVEGINRLLLNRFKLFSFETYESPSLFDDDPTLVLDYDLPDNPFFLKYIRDELRQVNERLFLGQMYLTLPLYTRPVLYFALEK